MKGYKRILVLFTLVLTTLFSGSAFSGPGENGDRTLSPFFFVKSGHPQVAREQGKTASLLEQLRPNVFQMNVAHILPGDTIRVELTYTRSLK
jgi:hypothetical protein